MKPTVSMPPTFQTTFDGQSFVMTRKWFSPAVWFLAVFSVFWDGFLFFWYTLAVTKHAPLFAIVFPVVHVLIGLLITYLTIACFVNSTRITMDPMQVSVRHGPMPWFGNRIVNRMEIRQLYCEKKVFHGKRRDHYSYDVKLVNLAGEKSNFITGLENLDQARFIEQQMEQYLGIKDMVITEEAQ